MDNIKKKLVKVICDFEFGCTAPTGECKQCENLADFLIDNGVTIQQWISVEERLPKKYEDVLVCYAPGKVDMCYRTPLNGFIYEPLYGKVTHWMPLPEPPKGE